MPGRRALWIPAGEGADFAPDFSGLEEFTLAFKFEFELGVRADTASKKDL